MDTAYATPAFLAKWIPRKVKRPPSEQIVGIDVIQRLRQLIPAEVDRNLHMWGLWRKSDVYVKGYPTHSTCLENLGGVSSPDASDHVYEELNDWRAEVADAIINEMVIQHKMAISHVYESAVWSFTRLSVEDVLVEAAREFWIKAEKKGLT